MEREYQKFFAALFGKSKDRPQQGTVPPLPSVKASDRPAFAGQALDQATLDHLNSLTPEDKKWIAYGVSGEAARNTDDEYGVAASMINRMRSNDFPNTAQEVVNQQTPVWQYEAVELDKAYHDPKLQEKLFAGDGLHKALKLLNGRKYFKGQTELSNRSNQGNELGADGKPIMDPMLHPKGNFFHYGHQ
tara:strand:+ start:245 stop:811 length:567 start_codon:yes stop_codon:yes gene_type:complete